MRGSRQLRATRSSIAKSRGVGYDPWEHAEALDIRVIERPIRSAHELWLPEHFTIVLRSGLRSHHKRVALTHGLGHAVHGHEDDRPKHETQADKWAARQLITQADLHAAAKWCTDEGQLCAELGVTRRLLEVYFQAVA